MTGPSPAPGSEADGHVHPTVDDPVVAAFSEGVGGPMGTRAGGHPWWNPTRVLVLLAAVCFALGMVQKSGCYEGYWSNDDRYTHMCYSDLPYLYTGRGFAELHWPYVDDDSVRARYPAMEYPVVISYWAWWSAEITQRLSGNPDVSERAGMPVDSLGARPEIRTEMLRFVAVNAIGFGALALLAAGAPTIALELAVLAPLGAASVTLAASINSALQLASDPTMRGRVMALYAVVFLGTTPIGGPLAGWLSEAIDPRAALVLAGLAGIAAGLLARRAFARVARDPALAA